MHESPNNLRLCFTYGEMKTQRPDTRGSTAVTDAFLIFVSYIFLKKKKYIYIKKIVLKQSLLLSRKALKQNDRKPFFY